MLKSINHKGNNKQTKKDVVGFKYTDVCKQKKKENTKGFC